MTVNPSEEEEVLNAPSLSVEEMKSFSIGLKGEPDKILIDLGTAPRDFSKYMMAKIYELLQNGIQEDWKNLRLIQSWPKEPVRQKNNPYIRDH